MALSVAAMRGEGVCGTPTPVAEERFNDENTLRLENGSHLGEPASGVSGLPGDRCYEAECADYTPIDKVIGPSAVFRSKAELSDASEITVCLWYKWQPAEERRQVVFSASGLQLFFEKERATVAVAARCDPPIPFYKQGYTTDEESSSWNRTDEWVFLAFVWSRDRQQLTLILGDKDQRAEILGTLLNAEAHFVGGLSRGAGAQCGVGNNGSDKFSPFNGSIDNLRIYSGALDLKAVEKVRLADLENSEPVF